MTNEVAFYRQLNSLLFNAVQKMGMSKVLDLDEIADKHGHLQLTIRLKDTGREIVVLDFSGTVPCMHLPEGAYPLEVAGPDLVRLRFDSGSEFTAERLATSIAERLRKEIAPTPTTKK